MCGAAVTAYSQKITVASSGRPATEVFAEVMRQSGKNFVYASDLLKGVKIDIDVKNMPLDKALKRMFDGTGIEYKVKGNNIMLKRAKKQKTKRIASGKLPVNDPRLPSDDSIRVGLLREVTIEGSRNQTLRMNSSHIGALNLSRDMIAKTPTLLGETDVIKTLQLEPGISTGIEGTAGMYVHGSNTDENLYMLDNIPLYQVNHFGGLFSAFNTEAIRNVDFYKSTFPAKFDGRLASYMDVYTRDGSSKGFSGSAKLGLTSGAAHLEGPIGDGKTTYMVAVRRSWYDVLTVPACALINKLNSKDDDDAEFGYAFTDVNAKITHRFSPTNRHLKGCFLKLRATPSSPTAKFQAKLTRYT